jgi:hypothetical protein
VISRVAVGLASLALVAGPVLAATPAHAVLARPNVAAGHASTIAGCVTGTAKPVGRYGHDPATITPAVQAKVQGQLNAETTTLKADAERTAARDLVRGRVTTTVPVLPAQIHVPVVIHIIHGTHKKDRNVSRSAARNLFRILKAGYAGKQDPTMVPTGVMFRLAKVTVSRNDSWYHARPGTRADKQMKRKLHRGQKNMLNIYLNSVSEPDGALLGFSRFPWAAARQPKLDGITINVASMPGGRAHAYNLGDTVIHESGHWLGLFHTFQGGCEAPGDGVADTPAEAEPSFKCNKTRDTCPTPLPAGWVQGDPLPAPELDPVTDFMDYSYDTCMNHFTPGQRTRMVTAFLRYRAVH